MNFKLPTFGTFFFGLCLFFIPFDGVGIIHLGEFSSEAYILFLLIFIVVWSCNKLRQPLYIPKISFEIQLFLLFVGIILFSSLINLPSILENEHPLRNGIRKLIGQFAVLFFFFPLVLVLFYDFFRHKKNIVKIIRRVFVFTLYLVFIVGFFEALWVVYKVPFANKMLDFFEQIPLMSISKNTWAQRISSFTKEPPSLGMFLLTVLPWVLVFRPKKHKIFSFYLPLFFIVFLTFYSGSRSGMFIVLVQFLVFYFLKFTRKISIQKITTFLLISSSAIILIPVLFFSIKDIPVVKSKLESFKFIENYKSNMSNKTRLGTYIASLETAKKHPLIGVGYGQAGFYVVEDYPAWAAKNNIEIEQYRSGIEFPPMFNIYFRYLVEIGVLGLVVFLCFLGFMLLRSVHWWYKGPDKYMQHYLVLVLSVIGFAFTWIQFDTLRVLGVWVFFAFYLYVYHKTYEDVPED